MSELRFKPTRKQYEAIKYLRDDETESIGYGGGAGGGKSILGVFWTWMMCQSYPKVRYFWGRNELKNLKETTFVSYQEFLDKYNIPKRQHGKYNDNSSTITFENGSVIVFLDMRYKPSDPLGKRFGSMLLTGGFIDESYEVNFKYIDVLYSRINRWNNVELGVKGKILETFNPDKGHVYSRFYLPSTKGALQKDVKFIKALALDRLKYPDYFLKKKKLHPIDEVSAAGVYITTLLKRSKVLQERLLWGNFEYDDDPTRLIDYDSILALFSNASVQSGGSLCITADIALRGNDKFVICVWLGKVLIDIVIIDICGGKEVVDLIKKKARQYSVPFENIIYDADGLGAFIGGEGGFIPSAKAFKNGSKPIFVKKENYANLKSFCAYKFAKAVNEREYYFFAMMNNMELQERVRRELEQLRGVMMDDDLKTQGIVSKKEIKENLGFSPDILDACLMREYLSYAKKVGSYTGEAESTY